MFSSLFLRCVHLTLFARCCCIDCSRLLLLLHRLWPVAVALSPSLRPLAEICCYKCQLLNISYCLSTEEDVPQGKSLVVVAYNSLGWSRTDIIRIPVNDNNLVVKDSSGNVVKSQYIEMDNVTSEVRKFYLKAYLGISDIDAAKYWLVFPASVPPLDWNTSSLKNLKKEVNVVLCLGWNLRKMKLLKSDQEI